MKNTINETLVTLVQTDSSALKTVLVGLLSRQTEIEQPTKKTLVRNGNGFLCRDANFLTSVAISIKMGVDLPETMVVEARKRLSHYRRQATEILTEKQAVAEVQASAAPVNTLASAFASVGL